MRSVRIQSVIPAEAGIQARQARCYRNLTRPEFSSWQRNPEQQWRQTA